MGAVGRIVLNNNDIYGFSCVHIFVYNSKMQANYQKNAKRMKLLR